MKPLKNKGTKAQRHKGTEQEISLFTLCLCALVPLCLIFILPFQTFSQNIISTTNHELTLEQKKYIIINTSLSNANKNQLIDLCKKLNISTLGSREELLIRIKNFIDMKPEEQKQEEIEEQNLKDVIIIEKADEAEYIKIQEQTEEILSAYGGIHLKYNKILLKADNIKLNNITKDLMCEGNVILYDGAKEITGQKIFYNLKTEYGIIYQGKSKIGEFIYRGDKIKKVKNDAYVISQGQFTTCNEEPPHYYLQAKKIWVYPNNKIVLLDAYYVVSDTKLFWLPLFIRFQKGTGIITYWGKRQVEGWFMQNTFRFKLAQDTENNLKFDHYQKRGEYLGFDLHQNSKESEVLFSTSGAYDKKLFGDSNINPDTGELERSYRGKVSFKNRITFNEDKENESYNTTLRMSVFRQSDYSFIQDFEQYRVIKPEFSYYDRPIFNNDIYNQDENNWYVNLSDTRKNSSFNVNANWLFRWNPIIEKYKVNYATIPEISYSLNGILGENPFDTTQTNRKFSLYPKIRYDTSIRLTHSDYYNENGSYLKSLNSRKFDLKLSRAFHLLNFVSYNPGIGIGDQSYWGFNVSEDEKRNNERDSYTYGFVSESLQLGPSSVYLNFGHALQWRFKEPDVYDEYGKITSHSLSMNAYAGLIKGISYNAGTSYNLRYRKTEKFRRFENARFSDLYNNLNISLIRNVNISETYYYSIKNRQPLTSNLNLNYSIADMGIPLIKKIDQFSFNSLWNHNFQNPRDSNLHLNTLFNIKIGPYWSLNLSTQSVNERLYLYSKSLAKKYQIIETEKNAGQYEYRNFFVDLLNSINIFQPSKMRDSYFKLRNANISINHDLHCWEMGIGYTLTQRYFNYGRSTQYPYFEHSIWLRVNMKIETELGMKENLTTEPPTITY